MKLWMKLSISAALGLILALILPEQNVLDGIIYGLAEFTLRMGRFIIFPLLFFTIPVSVCQLRRENKLLNVFSRLLLFSLATALIYTLVALALSFVLPYDRIPILTDSSGWESSIPYRNDFFNPASAEILRRILPVNIFTIFTNPGDFILPALLFSFLLGTQLFHDREEAEPVYNLFDSFSRMFYKMNNLFITVLTFSLFTISFTALRHIRSISDLSAYTSFIRLVLLITLIVIFGIQPLFYFVLGRKNPYKEMRTFLSAIVTALFSGDVFFSQLLLVKTLKENSGMKRKISGLSLPFLSLFSRAGTSIITTVSMLIILKSYSSLELTAFQIFWVTGISIAVSFTLFAQSYLSVYTALITACSLYGRGLEDGYVLILPVLPILILAAGAMDTVNSAFLTLLFSDSKEFRLPEDPEDYI